MKNYKYEVITSWMNLLCVDINVDTVKAILDNEVVNGINPLTILQVYKLQDAYDEVITEDAANFEIEFADHAFKMIRIKPDQSKKWRDNFRSYIDALSDATKSNSDLFQYAAYLLVAAIRSNAFGHYSYTVGSIIANRYLMWSGYSLILSEDDMSTLLKFTLSEDYDGLAKFLAGKCVRTYGTPGFAKMA